MKQVAAVAVYVVLVLTALTAFGGDDTVAKQEAQKRFADGLHAYDVAEFRNDPAMYDAARQAFTQSYALYPTDKTLWNLALSEVDSGRYLKGLAHFRLYDEHQRVSSQPTHAKYKLLHEYLVRALNGTAHLTIEATAGTAIVVDGQPVGIAPLPTQDMEVGTHVVEGAGQRQEVLIAAGQIAVVTVAAPSIPPPPAPPRLMAQAAPAAKARPVTVVAPDHSARDVTRWSLSSMAVVSLATGVVFLVDANAQANDIGSFRSAHPTGCGSMQSTACQQTQGMQSRYTESVTVSQTTLIVGAITAVSAVAAWTVWPSSTVRIVPEAGERQAGLFVAGSF